MRKSIVFIVCGLLGLVAAGAAILYWGEVQKAELLRREQAKSNEDAGTEIKRLRDEIAREREKNLADSQKLLEQFNQATKDRDKALQEAQELKKRFTDEREMSAVANEDLNKLRIEVARLRKEKEEAAARLNEGLKKQKQAYDTRVLSLEAALAKAQDRLRQESERYHYNLGVVHTQNKEFDSAVSEFKTALAHNPRNAQAYYNLGIIFDDYFKDKENARYNYRRFLELEPNSDDAESVKEWLADLEK